MKYIISIALFLFGFTNTMQAQVAIGTTDETNHSFLVRTNELSGSSLSDSGDVIVDKDTRGGVEVGIGGLNQESASIVLNADNKAFLPNRVALVSTLKTPEYGENPITDPVNGMVIYNTATTGVPPNNVEPGLYIYNSDEEKWQKILHNPRKRITTKTYRIGGIGNTNINMTFNRNLSEYRDLRTRGELLWVKESASSPITSSIEIEADGAYVFFVFYGGNIQTKRSARLGRIQCYTAIRKAGKGGEEPQFMALEEVSLNQSMTAINKSYYTSQVVVLGANLKKGDDISFLVGSLSESEQWTLTDGTIVMSRL